MGIAGLGTYSSTGFYYAMSNRSKNSNTGNESTFSLLPKTDSEKTGVVAASNKAAVGTAQVAFSKCIVAGIRSEELMASQSQTSGMDQKTSEATMSVADLIKMLKESHKLTANELKEEKDWRDMSDEEWDKMLEGVDKYIDAFKERLRQLIEMQDEAAQKAALEADAGYEAIAASSAALAAVNGFDSGTSTDAEDSEGAMPTEGGDGEKNWTKKLKTDDQTILRTAKEAQKMEKMAQRKIKDIVNDTAYSSYEYISVAVKIEQNEDKTEEAKEPLKLIAMDINGIRCINDDTHETEWEIKFNSEAEYKKAAKMMKWFGFHMNNYLAATDEKQWTDFLSGKISEGTFTNTLKAQEV